MPVPQAESTLRLGGERCGECSFESITSGSWPDVAGFDDDTCTADPAYDDGTIVFAEHVNN